MQIFDSTFFKFKKLLANPMAIFVYGLLSKWYIMISIAALVVTFWVFKGLEKSGVMANAKNVIAQGLEDTKAVARYCTPYITNLAVFWSCLDNPPKYQPSGEEEILEKNLDAAPRQNNSMSNDINPYD